MWRNQVNKKYQSFCISTTIIFMVSLFSMFYGPNYLAPLFLVLCLAIAAMWVAVFGRDEGHNRHDA